MLNVRWAKSTTAKRAYAIVLLAYFGYLGFARCMTLVHSDRCLDAGGVYDATSDTCKR